MLIIVDDNHALRKMLIQLFQGSENFVVVGEASSGPEAVEQSKLCKPDLVLIDYSLPGFDGAEASMQIFNFRPQMTVIGFTSFDVPEVIEHFKRVGVSQIMSKDSDPQHLLRACLLALS